MKDDCAMEPTQHYHINVKPDNLDDSNAMFKQAPLEAPLFLNSAPKSGTHLLKNIFRMFVPVAQQHINEAIQFPMLNKQHVIFRIDPPVLSWGHLLFADTSSVVLKKVNHILLVRDPYDWVLSRARFFLSDNFQGGLDHLKNEDVNINDYLNMMIFGIHMRVPTLQETFLHNAVAWIGTGAHIVKYEDILKHVGAIETDEAFVFFKTLLKNGGIEIPDDWQERVLMGADRKQSGTARENLSIADGPEIPNELPEIQKKLVNIAAPGLREILGYC